MIGRQDMRPVTRAEWIAIGSMAISLATMVFGGGALWSNVQEHERRIDNLEASRMVLISRIETINAKVERIDANVEFLADLAREERQRDR